MLMFLELITVNKKFHFPLKISVEQIILMYLCLILTILCLKILNFLLTLRFLNYN